MKATPATPRYSPEEFSEDGSPVASGTPQPATILTMLADGPPLLVFTDWPMPPPCPGTSPPDPARATYIPPAGSHAIPRGPASPLATRLIPPLSIAMGVGVPDCAATEAAMGRSASTTRTRVMNLRGMATSPDEPVLSLLDDDGSGHPSVVLAGVGIVAGLGEGKGERLPRVEVATVEGAVAGGGGVGDGVVIGPGDGRPRRDRQRRWREGIILDLDAGPCGRLSIRCLAWRRRLRRLSRRGKRGPNLLT